MSFEIDICNRHSEDAVDLSTLRGVVEHALNCEGVQSAVISVAVVDNATIHQLNRQHLQHDYPTDVISFQLEWSSVVREEPGTAHSGRSEGAFLEGEVIVSYDYAKEMASRMQWSATDELTLYVVHGLLHICGYDDLTPVEKRIMRQREKSVLSGLGLSPVYPDDESDDQAETGGAA